LGRHREELDRAVIAAVGTGERIAWLDFRFGADAQNADAELKGLEFLTGPEYDEVRAAWAEFWPRTGTSQNWDAVGWLLTAGGRELLLVEAKAHAGELKSDCGAEKPESIRRIRRALDDTKEYVQAEGGGDWLKGYYQYANRLATLYFLRTNGVPARLVKIYFTGDERENGAECPADEAGWGAALTAQDEYLGLPERHALSNYIDKVFLPVGRR
jgi:hypothetical protein